LAKGVARNSRQEVTLLHKLYLISSPLAMLSRKEVLTVSIDVSLEVRNAREAGSDQAVQIALLLTTHRTRWSSMRLLSVSRYPSRPARTAHRCLFDRARIAKDGTMGG
jgi:hypothetical protein